MIDPKQRATLDQGIAEVSEVFPKLWRALYAGLREEGFDHADAIRLVCEYIAATCIQQR